MKRFAAMLLLAGCSTPMALEDAGTDAGSIDAGPQCFNVPARLQAMCVGLDFYRTNACAPTAAATVQAHLGVCDAGWILERGDCGSSLESARYQYGFPGDTYECLYARDGGTLVGALAFTDRGVLAAGTVDDCATSVMNACP